MWPEAPNETREYDIQVPVTAVHGHQVFRVKAASEEEALKIVAKKGEFLCEEVEVTGLDFDNAEVI